MIYFTLTSKSSRVCFVCVDLSIFDVHVFTGESCAGIHVYVDIRRVGVRNKLFFQPRFRSRCLIGLDKLIDDWLIRIYRRMGSISAI